MNDTKFDIRISIQLWAWPTLASQPKSVTSSSSNPGLPQRSHNGPPRSRSQRQRFHSSGFCTRHSRRSQWLNSPMGPTSNLGKFCSTTYRKIRSKWPLKRPFFGGFWRKKNNYVMLEGGDFTPEFYRKLGSVC